MQKPPSIMVTDLFPELLSSLGGLLASLSSTEWDHPTVCAGWTVKDVALHLLGGDIGLLSRRRDGWRGESNGMLSSWDELVVWLNRHNESCVQSTRHISPRLLCDLLKFTGEQVCVFFRSLDLDVLGGPVSWAGTDRAPIWLDVAREYTERWHHQQHIRDAVGKPGLTDRRYLAPVLAAFVHALPQAYQHTDAAEGDSMTLTIVGDAGGSWSVVREAGRWQLYMGEPSQARAKVFLPENVAWRLFTKGITKEIARAQSIIHGDQGLGDKVLEAVSIIA